jgi:restriction system protein
MTAAQIERAEKQAYQARQQARADELTGRINDQLTLLDSILTRGVSRSARIDLERQFRPPSVPALDLGTDVTPHAPPDWASFAPKEPGWWSKAFGGEQRYARQLAVARDQFAATQQAHEQAEAERIKRVKALKAQHQVKLERSRMKARESEAQLRAWLEGLSERRREDVERYLIEVVRGVPLPREFPRRSNVTFSSDDEHAVVEFELPGVDFIPDVRSFSYIKTKDELRKIPRPAKESQQLYRKLIGRVSLLVIRDLFDSDPLLGKVSFNGHVSRVHPATGQADYPCLISVVVTREEFSNLVLTNVDPDDCLRHLKALVSAHPYAVEAVRPLVDFDRSRYAFTQAVDIVAELDHRDDLMSLTPTEFEHLVRQLFEALPGMEGWTTQASKDDGIDGVIFNSTPITGGLTVVQAKQYSKTVGVDHVRELMGAMEHKRAGRGVLVTTSTFTKDAQNLGADYGGRIQLIDGPGLVYMMKEYLNRDVLIGRRAKKK